MAIMRAHLPLGCPSDGQHDVDMHGSLRHVAAIEALLCCSAWRLRARQTGRRKMSPQS